MIQNKVAHFLRPMVHNDTDADLKTKVLAVKCLKDKK